MFYNVLKYYKTCVFHKKVHWKQNQLKSPFPVYVLEVSSLHTSVCTAKVKTLFEGCLNVLILFQTDTSGESELYI